MTSELSHFQESTNFTVDLKSEFIHFLNLIFHLLFKLPTFCRFCTTRPARNKLRSKHSSNARIHVQTVIENSIIIEDAPNN